MPDMYAFQSASKPGAQSEEGSSGATLTPNILPCRIHHDGPIDPAGRFWAPKTDEKDDIETAHYRGRRLRGRRVAVPDGYQGVIATPTERILPSSQTVDKNEDVVEVQPEESVKILETQGTFEDMMVWGHEHLPAADDVYVKGVEEWVRFAETMHGVPSTGDGKDASK
ncbi:Ribonuclease H2 subunit C [Penicillium cosmopolitanum]|uniref:Ribonuclease H2 subunit C n=1 Tax=Penicillium cosmopolitanum TaxID=1131564 RepID=A0A9X0BED8_9EURO|nr:Ribonuclease H2 subunit C [Penicillium cosmopolitanum]KAJ5413989.1 Ribonuclease H2 subunit C [Penicillium cosmopolitanum]